MRVACTALCLWGSLVAVPGAQVSAQEVEEILSYDVLVDVRPGGLLAVNERITVRALGEQIRRGIYRDFPTSFPRLSGLQRIEAPFEVRSVLRDGQPEPYAVLATGDGVGRGGVRIRAGRSDVFLDPGVYEYTFEYETDRWVRFGEREDELYWNVTGNGWSFPIRSATARVRIEELGTSPELEVWTGREGSTATDAEYEWDPEAREAVFRTTGALGRWAGLTVRLTFPSGHLTPPTEEQRAAWFALDWGGYIEAGWLVLFVVGVYLVMWRRVGMDPAPGPTVLRREPPAGFSPAALSYLESRGYGVDQLAAALVSMAMKGAIRIERTGDSWTLHNTSAEAELSTEEQRVYETLLGHSSSIELEQSQHARLRGAISELRRSLSRQLEREYFVNNRRWFLAGLGVSVAGLAVLAWRWRFNIDPVAWFLAVWLAIWTAGVATMVIRVVQMARAPGSRTFARAGALTFGLFALPFVGAEIFVAGWLTRLMPSHLVLGALLVGATNVLFYHLLERPTIRGRGILDQLEGFKAYLEGSKAGDFDNGGTEHFERFLPHAIALGLEERWAEGFGSALEPTSPVPSAEPTPAWFRYHGSESAFDPGTFASSLGSSLTSTLSNSSSPPPSSGSGGGSGGGGGFSGGGGGGGGGGGW